MIIEIKKFGKMLISRPSGKEALAIMLSGFKPATDTEPIELDFEGVEVMGPSWLEEVLLGLEDVYGSRVVCRETDNVCVNACLKVIRSLEF